MEDKDIFDDEQEFRYLRFRINWNLYYFITTLLVLGKGFGWLTWNWIWVFCPLWIPLIFEILLILLCVIAGYLYGEPFDEE